VNVMRSSMELGSCCVLRPNATATLDDDQIVPDHAGDCSNGGWSSSGQNFVDTWIQMQV
jgi:hypothetical protein